MIREGPVVAVAVAVAAPALGVEAVVPLVLRLTSPAPNPEAHSVADDARVYWCTLFFSSFFWRVFYICVRVLRTAGVSGSEGSCWLVSVGREAAALVEPSDSSIFDGWPSEFVFLERPQGTPRRFPVAMEHWGVA